VEAWRAAEVIQVMAAAPALISGIVRTVQGKAIPQARVYVSNAPVSVPDVAALTDDQGRFSFSVPAPGRYTLESAAEGFAQASSVLDVHQNQTNTVQITLPPA
jgi:hypothetical protein